MRKLNTEFDAVVMLSVKVKLGLLVWADDDAKLDRIVRQFAKSNLRTSKADVEDVQIEVAVFADDLDADDPMGAQVSNLIDGGGRITLTERRVTDS